MGVVFDITSRESLESTSKWIADVRAQRGNDVVIVLVGNKSDLAAQRAVTTAELEARAAEQEIMFIETSAKEGFNIKLLFRRLATALPALESNGAESAEQVQVVNLTTAPPASANGGNGDADSASSYCGC